MKYTKLFFTTLLGLGVMQSAFADECYKPESFADIISWGEINLSLETAAEGGQTEAMMMLAHRLIAACEYKEATVWLKKAAEQGVAEAQHDLGMRYVKGDGAEKDLVEAAKWFQRSADQGYQLGLVKMALFHFLGLGGVEKDPKKAKAYYLKSCEQDSERCLEEVKILEKEANEKSYTP